MKPDEEFKSLLDYIDMDYKIILGKFVKGAIFGAGSALFSVDLSSFALNDNEAYKKFGIIVLSAVIAGALHGLWQIGKEVFKPK